MKKTFVALTVLFSMAVCAAGSDRRDADLDRIQTASTVLSQIMSAPDRAIPDGIMSGAKWHCDYAVNAEGQFRVRRQLR